MQQRKEWEIFCKRLSDIGILSVSANSLVNGNVEHSFISLKHDVETNPGKALAIAKIESKFSHIGSYYVQAYLLSNPRHTKILKEIMALGHEVSYHYDVMDNNNGNIDAAIVEFGEQLERFKKIGCKVSTVCQHGNPMIERTGYRSNRDFFRNPEVREKYPHIFDIMVNFKSRIKKDYKYISDAGYAWSIIVNPENADLSMENAVDIRLDTLKDVLRIVSEGQSVIVSMHPHRWHATRAEEIGYNIRFYLLKNLYVNLSRNRILKSLLGRMYRLAKRV